jgi:hypothetical protein
MKKPILFTVSVFLIISAIFLLCSLPNNQTDELSESYIPPELNIDSSGTYLG